MIKEIVLKNILSHRNSRLVLNSGVNIIVGDSDVGKTSIIRALRWLIFNESSNLMSWWMGNKDKSEIEILLEEGISIKRGRTQQKNYYKIGSQLLEAFGRDCPKEVTDAHNMDRLNFQDQMDSPFLLSSSSGEVASYLNQIVDLSVIDRTQKALNKKRLGVMSEKRHVKKQLEDNQKLLEEFKWIDQADKIIEEVEIDSQVRDIRLKSVSRLRTLKSSMEEETTLLSSIPNTSLLNSKLSDLEMDLTHRRDLYSKSKQLQRIYQEIIRIRTYLDNIPNIDKVGLSLDQIEEYIKEKDKKLQQIQLLRKDIKSIEHIRQDIADYDRKIQKLQEKYELSLPSVCPVYNVECPLKVKK